MYITPQELLIRLLNDGGDLTEDEVEGFIEEWKAELARVNSTDDVPEPTRLTERIVRVGAHADALEEILERDGIFDHPAVTSRREAVERMLAEFDKQVNSPGEGETESKQNPAIVYVDSAPFYRSARASEEHQQR